MKYTIYFVVYLFTTLNAQKMTIPEGAYCDPATGLCTPAPIGETTEKVELQTGIEIIYVGDPMCSWCWGISPELNRLATAANNNGIEYRIALGGLRPGGGDPWNEQFKNFLRHHWEEVNKRSGQPFGEKLFERESFNYNTEPACRAVVCARQLAPELEGRFFELVQHYFYVRNEDPNEVTFYEPICKELGVDFERFKLLFESDELRWLTAREFRQSREWGVRGFPTVLLRQDQDIQVIARGYADFMTMWNRIEEAQQ
ncbi:MAG: DsbA family protein [Bacteroidota bacterium]